MKFILRFAVAIAAASVIGCKSKSKAGDDLPPVPPAEEVAEPAAESAPVSMAAPWDYQGATGPDKWGDLNPEFVTCKAGLEQSPVNLRYKKPEKGGEIKFAYLPSALQLSDTGHTVEAKMDPGSKVMIRGVEYELTSLHFHSSSEHTLSGNSLPLELHLMHKNAEGKTAIIGIFVIEGKSHDELDKILVHAPKSKNLEVKPEGQTFNPVNLLPKRFTYYHYTGSMTTPPCTEGVNWNVFNTPIQASKEQIIGFRALYDHNNRPVQPVNERTITNY